MAPYWLWLWFKRARGSCLRPGQTAALSICGSNSYGRKDGFAAVDLRAAHSRRDKLSSHKNMHQKAMRARLKPGCQVRPPQKYPSWIVDCLLAVVTSHATRAALRIHKIMVDHESIHAFAQMRARSCDGGGRRKRKKAVLTYFSPDASGIAALASKSSRGGATGK